LTVTALQTSTKLFNVEPG